MAFGDYNLTKKGVPTKTEAFGKIDIYQNVPPPPSISLKLNEEIVNLLKNRPSSMKLSINDSQNSAVSISIHHSLV